eukprot:scaffold221701_cov30-Tisochrysis_lutea.AAC.2
MHCLALFWRPKDISAHFASSMLVPNSIRATAIMEGCGCGLSVCDHVAAQCPPTPFVTRHLRGRGSLRL